MAQVIQKKNKTVDRGDLEKKNIQKLFYFLFGKMVPRHTRKCIVSNLKHGFAGGLRQIYVDSTDFHVLVAKHVGSSGGYNFTYYFGH